VLARCGALSWRWPSCGLSRKERTTSQHCALPQRWVSIGAHGRITADAARRAARKLDRLRLAIESTRNPVTANDLQKLVQGDAHLDGSHAALRLQGAGDRLYESVVIDLPGGSRMKRLVVIGSLLLLAGCVTAEEAAQQRLANINRSCNQMGYTAPAEHQTCMRNMIALTNEMRAVRAERVVAAGAAMQQAGAALSSISPPPQSPPAINTPVQCSTSANGRSTMCW
jgi:hypothetical protein